MSYAPTRRAAAAFAALLFANLPSPASAQAIDQTINDWVAYVTTPFVNFIFSKFPGTDFPWIVLWLITAATVFTLYFAFVQFRCFGLAVSLVRGDYSSPKDAGEVSHFQALSTALSGTVGLGNIAGVTVALSIGGPGATFWMILAGLMGMASKFTECTLGVKYRNEYPDGTVSGGPMYYLSKGLAEKGLGGLGRVMAVFFAICCVLGAFGGGNMFQANQVHAQLVNVTGGADSFLSGRGWLTGLVMATVVFVVIVGGIKSIARFAERIVPLMALIYCGTALAIILLNIDKLPWAIGQIVQGAFTEMGAAGGAIGALIQGFRRAAFSNEAGVGSASIAHSAVRTNEPVTEGFVSLLEPFIDTVVICTMTALVIVITGVLQVDPQTGLYAWDASAGKIATPDGLAGVALTSYAFATTFGWFPYVLALAVILFAFSTMVSWSYYGVKAWTYMFGEGRAKETAFNVLYCIFVVIGAAMNLGAVIDFADAALFAMALVNIAGLYILMPVVKQEMNSYLHRLETGEIRKTRR
jgi:AGCS family alanine or glycine:cation symporter